MIQTKARCGAIAVAILLTGAVSAHGGDLRIVVGAVSDVSSGSIQVAGHRASVNSDSVVMSDGRRVSLASVQPGMPAEAEIDAAGRLILLDVKGVVE